MTAESLYCHLVLDEMSDLTFTEPAANEATNQVLATLPTADRVNLYYWYYATQVMAHMGGEQWQAWNNRLHPLIVNAQVRQGPYAGSWDPAAPLPDRWGPHAGRLYVTAMNLLSLEVQYRKLPLYEDTIK